jgi:hypothetical protein
MSINRTAYNALVDDDGSNTVGSPITKALLSSVLLNPIDAALLVVTAVAIVATDFTTSSGTSVDVTGATVTLTTTGGKLLVLWSGPLKAASGASMLTLNLDGVDGAVMAISFATTDNTVTFCWLYTVAAGSHTVKLRARNSVAAATTINGSSICNGTLIALELKTS